MNINFPFETIYTVLFKFTWLRATNAIFSSLQQRLRVSQMIFSNQSHLRTVPSKSERSRWLQSGARWRKKFKAETVSACMQISVWDDTAQRRASEGQVHGRHLGLHLAYLWAFPGICGHIGVPEHMPAYGHLGWPHAVMKNMGISGGKHTHIPTPTAHHCHYRRRFTLSEKKHCVLYVAISVFQPPFYHFYYFT